MIPRTLITHADEQMQKTLNRMKSDVGTLRTGRASTALLENVRVEYYGTLTPLNQLANIGARKRAPLRSNPGTRGDR